MWTWIQDNATLLSAIANACMVLIWFVYLQMFYIEHRRQHQPRLVLEIPPRSTGGGRCLLINMSSDHVLIKCVMVVVGSRDGDPRTVLISNDDGERDRVLVGPLRPGGTMMLGRVNELVRSVAQAPVSTEWIEMRAVGVHQSTSQHVGARRRFRLGQGRDGSLIKPDDALTEQLRSWGGRRRARRWLEQCVRGDVEAMRLSAQSTDDQSGTGRAGSDQS